MELSALLLVLTVGLLTPGPDFVLVLRGALEGMRRGQATVLGIVTGLALQMVVLVLGFGALAAHPTALLAVRYAGAAVLLWLGLKLLLRKRTPANPEAAATTPPAARTAFVEGLLCNLTNPKAFLFFASLFARTQDTGSGRDGQLFLAAVIVLHGLVCWSLVNATLQLSAPRKLLLRIQSPLLTVFGALLVAFALLAVLA